MIKVGQGLEIQALVDGRPLILGGTKIDFPQGLAGPSEGDILSRAVCHALLGASNLGEMSDLFPDHDPKYRDISGLIILELVKIR